MNRTPRQQLRDVRSFVANKIRVVTENADVCAARSDAANLARYEYALALLRAVERELA